MTNYLLLRGGQGFLIVFCVVVGLLWCNGVSSGVDDD